MSVEAMKQALEALDSDDPSIQLRAAVALRQAIAEAEKQEPIFYVIQATDRFGEGYEQTYWEDPNGFPVYAAPVLASDISQERVDETAKREHEFEEMVKRGTKAWADTPDDWVDELRGGADKQEPVAWISPSGELYRSRYHAVHNGEQMVTPLYTKREWVGLTDGDIAQTMHGSVEGSNMLPYQFARAIEAKLKERNT